MTATPDEVARIAAGLSEAAQVERYLNYHPKTGVFIWRERTEDMFSDSPSVSAKTKCATFNSQRSGKEAGYLDARGYGRITILKKSYLAHRLAWLLTYREWPKDQIDHIDHNPSNNALSNLRSVSASENNRNRSLHSGNKVGAFGVFWHRETGKWAALIGVGGKKIWLGVHSSLNDAIAARKEAEKKFGFHENHGNEDKSDG